MDNKKLHDLMKKMEENNIKLSWETVEEDTSKLSNSKGDMYHTEENVVSEDEFFNILEKQINEAIEKKKLRDG